MFLFFYSQDKNFAEITNGFTFANTVRKKDYGDYGKAHTAEERNPGQYLNYLLENGQR